MDRSTRIPLNGVYRCRTVPWKEEIDRDEKKGEVRVRVVRGEELRVETNIDGEE